jgi:hypothetical protein
MTAVAAGKIPSGDAQGGGALLWGEPTALMCASGVGWRAACFGVGGTRPPRLSPEGKRERGDKIPLLS